MHTTDSSPTVVEAFDELHGLVGGLAVMLLPLLVGIPGALLLALVILVTAPLVILPALAVATAFWILFGILGAVRR